MRGSPTSLPHFTREGLETESPLAQKIWRVSRVLGELNPFSEEIQSLTEPRIDWILEMYSRDHPDKLRFERASTVARKVADASVRAGWANVLIGHARREWESRFKPKLPFGFGRPSGI